MSQERTRCPKCSYTSGDDWTQCRGSCPMPGSPHYPEKPQEVVVPVEVMALLPYAYYMDPPDGGDVSPLEQLRRMAKDAERYRKIRAMHWNDSDLCVVLNPKDSVKLGVDCPSNERLDSMLDAIK